MKSVDVSAKKKKKQVPMEPDESMPGQLTQIMQDTIEHLQGQLVRVSKAEKEELKKVKLREKDLASVEKARVQVR